jgi:hypothetical protein
MIFKDILDIELYRFFDNNIHDNWIEVYHLHESVDINQDRIIILRVEEFYNIIHGYRYPRSHGDWKWI